MLSTLLPSIDLVSPRHLATTPLCPERWPFRVDLLPPDSYLVGGVVRDALLGREAEYLDLDFVMPAGSVETARAIARRYGAGFVVLDQERQIARVVFEQATVDFALQEGGSLDQDLRRRDFTVNAIAYDPRTHTLVDPLEGYEDLQRRWLRMLSPANLADDPLRLLRAYRQAAQLGFQIEPQTEVAIAQLAPLIRQVAAERVQSELNTLLRNPEGLPWLLRALQAGLLLPWLPQAQGSHLEPLQRLDRLAQGFTHHWPVLDWSSSPAELSKSSGRSLLALAKLTALLDSDPLQAEGQLQHLKYSRAEIRAAGLLRRLEPQLGAKPMTIREQFAFFQTIGNLLPALLLLWLAQELSDTDWLQTLAQTTPGLSGWSHWPRLRLLLERFLDPDNAIAHPKPLLSGKDLLQALNLRPGPQIGHLLAEIQIAQAEGSLQTSDEAIAFAAQLLDSQEAPV